MNQELTTVTNAWSLIPQESKALVQESLSILAKKEIGNSRMSPYQLKHFVINKPEHPTPWGQYKQCLAEIENLVHTLMGVHYLYRQHQARQKQAKFAQKWASLAQFLGGWVEGYADLKQAEIDHLEAQKRFAERDVEHKLLELKTFLRLANELHTQLGEKSYDELEEEYWRAREMSREAGEYDAMVKKLVKANMAKQMVDKEFTHGSTDRLK